MPSERDDRRGLEDVERALERAADERRAILDRARREADDADARSMERALARAARPDDTVRIGRPARIGWRVGLWGLAAAAVVVGLLLWLRQGADAPERGGGPSGILLGDPELRLVSPVGEVPAYGTLRWDFPSPDRVTFLLRVRDASNGETLLEERVEGRLSLAPDPRVSATWPARIELEVRALDAAGEPLASSSGSAWLGP